MRKNDHRKYRLCEMCVTLKTRGFYHDFVSWRKQIEKGASHERYIGVAAYTRDSVSSDSIYYSKYTLPFVILDVERGQDKKEAFNVIHRMLDGLSDERVSMKLVRVVNTGGRGFHLVMKSGMFGNPVFPKRKYADSVYSRVFEELFDEEIDPSMFNPSQIVRMVGSRHENGNYCISYTAEEFAQRSFNSVLEDSASGIIIGSLGSAYAVKENKRLKERFLDNWKLRNEVKLREFSDIKQEWKEGHSGIISRIEQGVEESEVWWEPRGYQGRSKAMFIYGQEMLRRGKTISEAWKIMLEVNSKNVPPLTTSELKGRLNSAKRSHARRGK